MFFFCLPLNLNKVERRNLTLIAKGDGDLSHFHPDFNPLILCTLCNFPLLFVIPTDPSPYPPPLSTPLSPEMQKFSFCTYFKTTREYRILFSNKVFPRQSSQFPFIMLKPETKSHSQPPTLFHAWRGGSI